MVFENLRFRPFTRKREASIFKNLHYGQREKIIYVFSDSFHLIRVDLRPRTGEKISVFKQKRILVDGTLETIWMFFEHNTVVQ